MLPYHLAADSRNFSAGLREMRSPDSSIGAVPLRGVVLVIGKDAAVGGKLNDELVNGFPAACADESGAVRELAEYMVAHADKIAERVTRRMRSGSATTPAE